MASLGPAHGFFDLSVVAAGIATQPASLAARATVGANLNENVTLFAAGEVGKTWGSPGLTWGAQGGVAVKW